MEKIKFNHDGEKIHESFCLTSEQGSKLDSIILFESIVADRILELDYHGIRKDAPREICTKTGVLARCFKYTTNEQERMYTAYAFINKHNSALALLSGYEALIKTTSDPKLRNKLLEGAREHFGDEFSQEVMEEKFEEMINKQIRPLKPMRKLIRQIDNSNYDYSLFKAMLDDDDQENPDSYISEVVDDMIEHIKEMRNRDQD